MRGFELHRAWLPWNRRARRHTSLKKPKAPGLLWLPLLSLVDLPSDIYFTLSFPVHLFASCTYGKPRKEMGEPLRSLTGEFASFIRSPRCLARSETEVTTVDLNP